MKVVNAIQSLLGNHKMDQISREPDPVEAIEKPAEMLRALPWLTKLEERVFQQVLNGFECRQFAKGETLLKEQDPGTGMFVIVEGRVRIEIRGIIMDELGPGSLIGEMAVLTGYPRSASAVATSTVTLVWIESSTLKSIMKKSRELENGLWEFTSKRFAMNLLGKKEPYSQWEQNIFVQWLAAGEIKLPNENGAINLKGKVGVLVTGTASLPEGSSIVKAPASLTGKNYIFSSDSRVYVREK